MAEDDARGAVDLGDDDALGAVDDEGSPVGHEGDVAEVDLLLPYLARLLEDQVDPRLEGHGVGEALHLALELRVLHRVLVEVVALVLEEHVAVGALDREGVAEDFFQAGHGRGPRRSATFSRCRKRS